MGEDYVLLAAPMRGAVTSRIEAPKLAESLRGLSLADVRGRLQAIPGAGSTARVEMWPTWAPAALRVDVVVGNARKPS